MREDIEKSACNICLQRILCLSEMSFRVKSDRIALLSVTNHVLQIFFDCQFHLSQDTLRKSKQKLFFITSTSSCSNLRNSEKWGCNQFTMHFSARVEAQDKTRTHQARSCQVEHNQSCHEQSKRV